MDTPQSTTSISSINNKLINPSSSDSPIVQDSPFFNFISNLSPIQPVKAEPGAQGFPGLASPPLLFTSPRINSLQSLLNRKLLSSGSNLESPQDNDKYQNKDRDLRNLAKPGPECNNLSISKEHKAFSMKSAGQVSPFSPGCIDDFLTDPHANSSSLRKSDAASQCPGSFSLEKKYGGSGKNVCLDGSTPVQFKKGAHAKSRISIKVVKNEARPLMQSSECLGSLPRSFTEHASEVCENGDSLNEASHLERGTLRRCLFEENQKKCFGESEFRNSSDNITRMEKLTNMPATRTADDGEMISLPKPASGSFVSPVTGSYPVAISKPLGIGLHLNSVVYPRVLGSSNGSQQSSLAGLERKNSASAINNHSGGDVNASLVGKVPATSEERYQNKSCSIATSGEAKPSDIEHLYIPVESKPDVSTTIKCVKRKISSRTAESNEEPHQLSPKKKRQKPSSIGEDDNLRRCNCKKSKCLKLYCDCFAAGLYCTESCACQGCCNRHEHEETVLETRKQIESRNPLAFAPKVVQQVTGSPSSNNEVQNQSTPSSARHKRGCNCKKSMCLKKYCECYQANVGCSEGCRCEGCKNVFGVREDYRIIGGFRVRKAADEMSEAKADGRQENSSVGSNFVNSRLHNFSNLTPPTPALQCSDLKKNALKSRLPFMNFLESPDTQNDVLSDDNFLTCPEFDQSHNMLPEKSTECKDEGALHAGKSVEITEDRRETAGDEPTSTSSLVSDSVVASMIPSSSSKANSSRNASQPRFFNESGIQSMSSSLRWRSSPITPIARSTGLEFQDFGSESKHNDISEDDTPDVLKDSSTPSSSVKVRSPHKKRVSAPHNPIDCSGSLESDSPFGNPSESSGSLKLCRRFVLRALPTFPSLTPLSKKQQSEQET